MRRFANNAGFTLIEVLLVLAIVSIMAMAMAPQYAKVKKSKAMSYAKTQIMNDLRYAQDSTLSGMRFPGTDTPPRGGYGIRFTRGSTSYTIFGDLGNTPDKQYGGAGETVETASLGEGIRVRSITVAGSAAATADYVCVPPYGSNYTNTQANVAMVIVIESSDAAMTQTISVSGSGAIN